MAAHALSVEERHYDILIVGAGMFGSSTAKHIRQYERVRQQHDGDSATPAAARRIAIIGPDTNTGELCRGQHYDEARICRRIETLLPWALLNSDGLNSYAQTERESGVSFYTPCGVVWVATAEDKEDVERCLQAMKSAVKDPAGLPFACPAVGLPAPTAAEYRDNAISISASATDVEAMFDGQINVAQFSDSSNDSDSGSAKIFYAVESGPRMGGTVHPTRYVAAQLACAAQIAPAEAFTHINDEVVVEIQWPSDPSALSSLPTGSFRVLTDRGSVYTAGRVVVAAASFALYHKLIPAALQAKLTPVPEHVVLLRVAPPPLPLDTTTAAAASESASAAGAGGVHAPRPEHVAASARLPAVIRTAGAADQSFYCLPPRYYADADKQGWFVKMGSTHAEPASAPVHRVDTLAAAMDWYSGRTPLHARDTAHLAAMLATIYPTWRVVTEPDAVKDAAGNALANELVVRCIWDRTADRGPIIDTIDRDGAHVDSADGGLVVALGGNGRGAKACDAVGRLAALRALGVHELPSDLAHYAGMFRA